MQTGGHIHQQLLLATGRTYHQLIQSADCINYQLALGAERAYDQSPQVEGRIHRQLLQTAGRLHYQLLMAEGRTYLHAVTDGGTCSTPTTTPARGTSSSPATRDYETYLHQPMRIVQLRHLQPLYVRPGHGGQGV